MCSVFESRLQKNQSILHNLPYSTIVPIDASTGERRRMERAPRRQSVELRKRDKIHFVFLYVIFSEYESSFLSLISEAKLCIVFDTDGPVPPVDEKIMGNKVAFSRL